MIQHQPTRSPPDLADLRYLERVSDFEGGMDRGPLSGKQILVYAPEKTGSVSLFAGIRDYFASELEWSTVSRRMLHNHGNTPLIQTLKLGADVPVPDRLKTRTIVRDLVEYKRLLGDSVLIVSSYREPLGRTISYVFHAFRNDVLSGRLDAKQLTVKRCERVLRSKLEWTAAHFEHSLTDIEPGFFRSERFDLSTRNCFVERDGYRILVLSLPHVDAWSPAFERHLGWKGVEFQHCNSAEQAALASIYRRFRSTLRLPVDLIRRLYHDSADTQYLHWFFGASEVDALCRTAIRDYGNANSSRRFFAWLPGLRRAQRRTAEWGR